MCVYIYIYIYVYVCIVTLTYDIITQHTIITVILRPILLPTLHPTDIAGLKLSGKSPMNMGIPPL